MTPLWPKLLDRLVTIAPGIRLRVENFAPGAAERMAYGDLDCWIVEEHRSDPQRRTESLWRDRWVVIGCAEYYSRRRVHFDKFEGRLIMTREGEATTRPRAIDWTDLSPGASVRADLPSRVEAALCIPGTLQWHPSRERDPGGIWFRGLLKDVARSVHPKSKGPSSRPRGAGQ